jgi:hypothetical protein
MEWFLAFVVAVGFVLFTLFRNEPGPGPLETRPEPKIPAGSKDEFAGNTVESFFLMEELVDNPQNTVGKADEPYYFEEEILFYNKGCDDEFFKEEGM